MPGGGGMAFYDRLEAITLVCGDLERTKAFCRDVFEADWVYEDPACAMLEVGPLVVNLLARDAAVPLVRPREPGRDGGPARAVFTLRVEGIDAACARLAAKGGELLDGPEDQPWGRRTATFADPAGHVWELAQVLWAQQVLGA